MKQAAVTGRRRAALVDVADPKPVEDWALVKVHAAPMCTEFKAFDTGARDSSPGHEAAGEVVDVARPGRVKIGDRVVVMPHYACGTCPYCRSGEFIYCQEKIDVAEFTGSPKGQAAMAQYLLKPDWLLPAIPEGVSYERASLACCGLGPTFGAFERIGLRQTDTLLLTGLGPVGLGGIINAAARGARVIGVEPHPWRAALAVELGAETVVDPRAGDALQQIRDLTDGLGPDKATDCSGTVACAPSLHRCGASRGNRRVRRGMQRGNARQSQRRHDPEGFDPDRFVALQSEGLSEGDADHHRQR